ncbi:hypothetical protein VKS41_004503 [Umbelopsis sp. WA50703]
MFCAISGEAPEQPVLSTKSGLVYEKRLILKQIGDTGKDPNTGEDLTAEDLIDIKTDPTTVKPRPPTLTSIPSLLTVFQNEWDSMMLETFTLKQQYQQVRQELSHALYQNDAASRVIARLLKERDSAREALANVQAHLGTQAAPATTESESMDVDSQESGLPAEAVEKINATSEKLSATRKKRKPPTEHASAEAVGAFTQTESVPSMHNARPAGVTALDIDDKRGNVLTGGNDKHVQVYSREKEKVLANLTGHTKKITSVKFRGDTDGSEEIDIAVSASADKSVRVWGNGEKGYGLLHNIHAHKSDVNAVTVHPSKDYFVSASSDSTWAFHEYETGSTLLTVSDSETDAGYTAAHFHPDGMILGCGTADSTVRIWDIKSQRPAASFTGHTGKITALNFSENGYILAVASEDNLVKLWDLRNLTNTKTFELDEGYKVHDLKFDYYAKYLAVAGTDLRVLKAKDGASIATFKENTSDLTGVHWDPLAQYVAATGLDRTLRFFSTASQ